LRCVPNTRLRCTGETETGSYTFDNSTHVLALTPDAGTPSFFVLQRVRIAGDSQVNTVHVRQGTLRNGRVVAGVSIASWNREVPTLSGLWRTYYPVQTDLFRTVEFSARPSERIANGHEFSGVTTRRDCTDPQNMLCGTERVEGFYAFTDVGTPASPRGELTLL
jgi:hypothetical protein